MSGTGSGDAPGIASPSHQSRDEPRVVSPGSYVTDEDDDRFDIQEEESSDESSSSYDDDDDGDSDRAALAYLLRYEHMVRQQELEEEATVAHLRPLFERIRILGGEEDTARADVSGGLVGSPLSYDALTGQDPNSSREEGVGGEEEEEEVLSFRSMQRALAILQRQGEYEGTDQQEVMGTDEQLMLVLQKLVDTFDDYTLSEASDRLETTAADPASTSAEMDADERQRKRRELSLTFPEFLHCYRTVILGMQTLQQLPGRPTTDRGEGEGSTPAPPPSYQRTRTQDRTMAMIRAFGPRHVATTGAAASAEEARRLLVMKDRQMAQILDEQAREIDRMAVNMQGEESAGAITEEEKQRRLATGRRKALLIAFLAAVGVVGGAGLYRRWRSDRLALAESREDVVTATQEDKVLSDRLRNLQSSVKESKKTIAKLESQDANNQVQLTNLRKVALDTSETLREKERELVQAQSKIDTLDDRIEQSEEETKKATRALASCQSDLESTVNDLEETRLTNSRQVSELGVCRDHLKEAAAAAASKEKDGEEAGKTDEEVELLTNEALRRLVLRRQILSAAGGVLAAFLIPHLLHGLGWLGSATPRMAKATLSAADAARRAVRSFLGVWWGEASSYWDLIRGFGSFLRDAIQNLR